MHRIRLVPQADIDADAERPFWQESVVRHEHDRVKAILNGHPVLASSQWYFVGEHRDGTWLHFLNSEHAEIARGAL